MLILEIAASISAEIYIALVISFLWRSTATNSSDEYCDKFSGYCTNKNHTMCMYKNVSYNCKNNTKGGLTQDNIKEILDAHNSHRNVVAAGNESRGNPGPQPPAANMMKISWDEDLALVAQRWADQCKYGNDECRNTSKGEPGQIHFRIDIYEDKGEKGNWTETINGWYNEVTKFPNSCVASYRSNESYEKYTQMVWGRSYLVGCGQRNYTLEIYALCPNATNVTSTTSIYSDPGNDTRAPMCKRNATFIIYICNYYPKGNIQGKPVYINGTACSKCPPKSICEDNLCVCSNQTTIDPVPSPGFWDAVKDLFNSLYRWIKGLFVTPEVEEEEDPICDTYFDSQTDRS